MNIQYKGYSIESYPELYDDMITVQVDGDDMPFNSIEDAKAYIDEMVD